MRRAMILLRRSPYRRRAGRGRSCRAVVSTDPNPRRRRGGLREAAPSSGSVLGDGAAGGDDLLLGRRREGVGRDVELDAQVAGAEHLDLVARAHRDLSVKLDVTRSEENTYELQSLDNLVCCFL